MVTTIAEVASRAGVGVGTVSRVLNGSASVSEATRLRVRAVIDELGYEPHAAARALSTGRTGTVGVVAPFFTQPSVVERLRGVSREISRRRLPARAVRPRAPRAARAAPRRRAAGRAPVRVAVPVGRRPRALRRRGVAVALIDCEHPALPGVSVDDVAGGRLAAEHLLALGHRRVAFVGDDEDSPWHFVSSTRRAARRRRPCWPTRAPS